jgi:hypothetical protein
MSPEPTKKSAAKTPAKPAKTTGKATAKTPAKSTAKAPAKATAKTPAKAPAKEAAKATTKAAPAKKTGGAAKKAPAAKATGTTTKAAPKAKPKPKAEKVVEPIAPAAHDHDHDHDGHDHDGHDGHDHDPNRELTPEEQAQAEADADKMAEALAALDDDVMRRALADMSEKNRLEVAVQLQLPRATMHLGEALMPLVRRKLQTAGPDHQLQVLFALAQQVNDETIEALGDRAEDPSRDDLLEVLPPVVEKHGAPLVTAMLAGYAASDAVCRPVMRELLETDDRFVIGPPVAVEAKPTFATVAAPKLSDAELEAKREQRRAAKEAKRAAEIKARDARATAQAKRRQAVHDAKRKAR